MRPFVLRRRGFDATGYRAGLRDGFNRAGAAAQIKIHRLWKIDMSPNEEHQSLDALLVHQVAVVAQMPGHLPDPEKWRLQELLVDPPHQAEVLCGLTLLCQCPKFGEELDQDFCNNAGRVINCCEKQNHSFPVPKIQTRSAGRDHAIRADQGA